MKNILIICLIAITSVCYSSELPPPFSEKKYEIDEVYKNLYDLEGKVIKIIYTPSSPRQDSRTTYGDTVYGKNEAAYIVFPKEVGDARFKDKKDKIRPFVVYVQVTIGNLKNEYGGQREGAILLAVGRETAQGMSGPIQYTW